MKKLILSLHLSLLCVVLNANHQYKSVLDGEMIRWSFLVNWDCSGADIWGFYSEELVAHGDTLINDQLYKRLFSGQISVSGCDYDYDETNTLWQNDITPPLGFIHGYIRESEDASQLYFLDNGGNEFLIYDLNLAVGDKFPLAFSSTFFIEITVDSVYVKNNLKHIQFDYIAGRGINQLPLTFIESVGPTTWAWFSYCGELNCFQNQTVFYKNDLLLANGLPAPCGYDCQRTNIRLLQAHNFHITINSHEINLYFFDSKNVQISLYDMLGELHYTQSVFSQSFIIPTAKFSKGVYLLKIFDRNTKQTNIEKIIL